MIGNSGCLDNVKVEFNKANSKHARTNWCG
jgi:hypothetical protein